MVNPNVLINYVICVAAAGGGGIYYGTRGSSDHQPTPPTYVMADLGLTCNDLGIGANLVGESQCVKAARSLYPDLKVDPAGIKRDDRGVSTGCNIDATGAVWFYTHSVMSATPTFRLAVADEQCAELVPSAYTISKEQCVRAAQRTYPTATERYFREIYSNQVSKGCVVKTRSKQGVSYKRPRIYYNAAKKRTRVTSITNLFSAVCASFIAEGSTNNNPDYRAVCHAPFVVPSWGRSCETHGANFESVGQDQCEQAAKTINSNAQFLARNEDNFIQRTNRQGKGCTLKQHQDKAPSIFFYPNGKTADELGEQQHAVCRISDSGVSSYKPPCARLNLDELCKGDSGKKNNCATELCKIRQNTFCYDGTSPVTVQELVDETFAAMPTESDDCDLDYENAFSEFAAAKCDTYPETVTSDVGFEFSGEYRCAGTTTDFDDDGTCSIFGSMRAARKYLKKVKGASSKSLRALLFTNNREMSNDGLPGRWDGWLDSKWTLGQKWVGFTLGAANEGWPKPLGNNRNDAKKAFKDWVGGEMAGLLLQLSKDHEDNFITPLIGFCEASEPALNEPAADWSYCIWGYWYNLDGAPKSTDSAEELCEDGLKEKFGEIYKSRQNSPKTMDKLIGGQAVTVHFNRGWYAWPAKALGKAGKKYVGQSPFSDVAFQCSDVIKTTDVVVSGDGGGCDTTEGMFRFLDQQCSTVKPLVDECAELAEQKNFDGFGMTTNFDAKRQKMVYTCRRCRNVDKDSPQFDADNDYLGRRENPTQILYLY